jgi:hypothetical protein
METTPDRMSDFSRLARFLTGTSIGVVLGGGGARYFKSIRSSKLFFLWMPYQYLSILRSGYSRFTLPREYLQKEC